MSTSRKIESIEKLLEEQKYTTAARECLILIEGGLRDILINKTKELGEQAQQQVRAEEQKLAKSARGKSFKNFTLGQLIRVLIDSDFFEAWAKVSQQKFPHLIDLEQLNKLRTELFHAEGWATQREATQYEAKVLVDFIRNFGDFFEFDSDLQTESQDSSVPQSSSKWAAYSANNTVPTMRMRMKNFSIEASKSVGWFMLTVMIGLATVWLDTLICSSKGCNPSAIVMDSLFLKSSLLIVCITIVAALLNDNLFVNCEYTRGWEKFLFSLVPIFYFGGGIATYVLFSSENNRLEVDEYSSFVIQFQLIFFIVTLLYASFIKWYGWRYGHYVCSFDVKNKIN